MLDCVLSRLRSVLTSSVSPMLGWLELLVQHNNTCQVISVASESTQGCFTVSVKRNWKDEIVLGFFYFIVLSF